MSNLLGRTYLPALLKVTLLIHGILRDIAATTDGPVALMDLGASAKLLVWMLLDSRVRAGDASFKHLRTSEYVRSTSEHDNVPESH